jgi:type I restriction enzyme S subunit
MEEWKTYKLSEIGTIVGGATPSTKVAENYDGDIPWITPKDLSNFSGRFIEHGERNITQKGFDSCSCQMLPKNSVLFSSRAPIGYVAIAAVPLCTNQGFKSVVPNEEIVDPRFLYYLLKFNKDRIAEMGSGTTFMEVSGGVMKNVEVSLPELMVQEHIADVLSSIDEKIELNNRINHNLEEQIQERFDSMIISDNGLGYCQIADFIDVNPKRSLRKNEPAKCVDMSYLSTTGPFPSGWETKGYNGGMKFVNGDTIMARITPCLENGKVAYVNFLNDGEVAFGSTEYIVLHAKEGVAPVFTYFLARNKNFVDYATKNMNGSSGRQRVSGDTIGKYMIPVIVSDSLNEFSRFATPAMEVIRNNSFESRSLAATRDALLPLLLSGELSISQMNC